MKILYKLILIILIPLLCLIYYAKDLTFIKLENLNNVEKSYEFSELTMVLTGLIDNIQEERNLSI
jgi:hypothetical protein